MRWRVYCCVPGRTSLYRRFSYVTFVPTGNFFHARYCGESGIFVTGAAVAAAAAAGGGGAVSHPGLDSVNAADAAAASSTFNWSCVRNLIPAPAFHDSTVPATSTVRPTSWMPLAPNRSSRMSELGVKTDRKSVV